MARELENTINERLETFKELGLALQNPTATEENVQLYHMFMKNISHELDPVISLIEFQAPEMYKVLVTMKENNVTNPIK